MKFQALFSWKNKSKKIKVVGAVVFIRINMVIQVPGYALISVLPDILMELSSCSLLIKLYLPFLV